MHEFLQALHDLMLTLRPAGCTSGDVWAVVGWSQDLITIGERSRSMEVVAPRSGTSLFADVWAVPAHAQGGHMQQGPSPILPAWLEFGLMPSRVSQHSGLKTGESIASLAGLGWLLHGSDWTVVLACTH